MTKKSLTFFHINDQLDIIESAPMDIMISCFKELDKNGFKTIDEIIPIYNVVTFTKNVKVNLQNKEEGVDSNFLIIKLKEGNQAILIKPTLQFNVAKENNLQIFETTKEGYLKKIGKTLEVETQTKKTKKIKKPL